MDDIESSVSELQRLVGLKAPIVSPPVFPSNMHIRSVFEICDNSKNSNHRNQIERWLQSENCTEDQVVFSTTFDYKRKLITLIPRKCEDETDRLLGSLEQLMSLFTLSAEFNTLKIANSIFLEKNSYSADSIESSQNILYEVCNILYTLKVLMSNIPGITFSLGPYSLPLSERDDAFAILEEVTSQTRLPSQQDDDIDEDMMQESDLAASSSKGRRKKKRGGGRKI